MKELGNSNEDEAGRNRKERAINEEGKKGKNYRRKRESRTHGKKGKVRISEWSREEMEK